MNGDNHLGDCRNFQRLRSPCKVNLGLSIVGRKADGFHLLESLFWPLNLEDSLRIRRARTHSVTMRWASDAATPKTPLPQAKQNLVLKALEALFPDSDAPKWEIEIDKRIPLGGGLGGGSSNAGAVLRFLRDRYPGKANEIEKLAPKLGADVPFFLGVEPAWVTGIGETTNRFPLTSGLREKLFFLLIIVPHPTSTQKVFHRYRTSSPPFSRTSGPPPIPLDWSGLMTHLRNAANDLESAAVSTTPRIGKVLEKLRQLDCAHAGLSGSGSTCYAIFTSPKEREKSVKEIDEFLRLEDCKSIYAESYREL